MDFKKTSYLIAIERDITDKLSMKVVMQILFIILGYVSYYKHDIIFCEKNV